MLPLQYATLYVSSEHRELILRRYGNMTLYIAKVHGRELKRETRLVDTLWKLELGPAIPMLSQPQRRLVRG